MSTQEPFFFHIVRSDGQTLDVGDGTEWVLSMNDMSDWVPLDYGVETSANVLTDGSTLVSKRVNEKDRTIRCVYWGRDRKGVRDRVISFFNPKYSFEAHLTYFGRTRWCEGEQIGFWMDITDERTPPSFTWTILCLDPYMRGEDVHDETMTDARPMFTFPFRCFAPGPGVSAGCVASFRVYDGLNTVVNKGEINAPFRITCEFGAAAENPTFHVNDKHVSMIKQFASGDVLTIDFMAAPPRVEINGVNSIQSCTRDSNFVGMVLRTGENRFSYEFGGGDVNDSRVSIVYYERYMGV